MPPSRSDPNTGDYVLYSYRIVSGFFNVPYYLVSYKGYETGPPVYSPYPRRLESLTICRCNYKGSSLSYLIKCSHVPTPKSQGSFGCQEGSPRRLNQVAGIL